MSISADDVKIICSAFNKLNVFKFEAKMSSTFLRFCVANFKGIVFFDVIINNFCVVITLHSLQIFKKAVVFEFRNSVSKFSINRTLFRLL